MNTREKAFKALIEVEEGGYSNLIANKYSVNLDNRERGFLRELLYGTIENTIYYDWIISKFSKVKLKKIDINVKAIMKIAIHQIISLERVPDSAAVNEAVKLVNKYSNRGAKGYANGLLRNISRNKDTIGYPDKSDFINYLSIRYSYPKWLVKTWIKEFGKEFTESLMEANSKKHYMNIRVNTIKIEPLELENILLEQGYKVERSDYSNYSFKIHNPTGILDSDLYREGMFDIQDTSSTLVGEVASPKKKDRVLDLCAAPGSKTMHIAAIMENDGMIESRDIYKHKIAEIEEKMNRLKVSIVKTSLSDASRYSENDFEKWDICIADVPCSALGLIRNKPEIKLLRKEEDLKIFPHIQKKIINNAASYVKKGGILVYSTCTINKKENQDIIYEFLKENKNFKLEDFSLNIKESDITEDAKLGMIQLFPNVNGTNGFFIAKLKKC